MGDAAAKIFELTVGDDHFAALRDDDGLRGELLFDTDGAAVCANAHCAGGVEADEGVLRRVADGEGLGLELRGIDGERGLRAWDARENLAKVEGQGEHSYGVEY